MPKPSKKDCAKYCELYNECQSKNWQCKRGVVFSDSKTWMGTVAEVRQINGKMAFRRWKEPRECYVNGDYFWKEKLV